MLIAASSLRNKDKLLEMMKAHQQAQAQQQQQAGQMAQQHAQATIQGVQAKAAADAALAKERGVNVLSKIHEHARGLQRAALRPAERGRQRAAGTAAGAGTGPRSGCGQRTGARRRAAHHGADQHRTPQGSLEAARARDLHMASVKKAAETHAIMHPPPPAPPRRGA